MDSSLEKDAKEIWYKAIEAVSANAVLPQCIKLNNHTLELHEHKYSLDDLSGVLVVGFGKAAAKMAECVEDILKPITKLKKNLRGLVNAPESSEKVDNEYIKINFARPSGLNRPTEKAFLGCEKILDLVQQADENELILVLISGGGSALSPAPAGNISLEDKINLTSFLNEKAGASIEDLNYVRRTISKIKGGGLLRKSRGKAIHGLIISDVIGNDPSVIASGPLVETNDRPETALNILKKYDPEFNLLPQSIYQYLQNELRNPQVTGPKLIPCYNHIIASNHLAVEAAISHAKLLGYQTRALIATENSAQSIGQQLAGFITNRQSENSSAIIGGGEPVVNLPAMAGKGGRNQQIVLQALSELLESTSIQCDYCILSAGSDGEDGPTDAAGALASPRVLNNSHKKQLNCENYLVQANAYTYFKETEGLFMTGLTGTNVCDIWIALKKTVVNR